MTSSKRQPLLHIDEYSWGRELIVWGYASEHQYTFKILEPKRGKAGCLSLQYHLEKSESWMVVQGEVWALLVIDGQVCTRILRVGDIQNIPKGVIHRLMGISEGARVAEPSTPDRHAADKKILKDVVRLHCVFGRAVAAPRNNQESVIVETAVKLSLEAASDIEAGRTPKEYNRELLDSNGALSLKDF